MQTDLYHVIADPTGTPALEGDAIPLPSEFRNAMGGPGLTPELLFDLSWLHESLPAWNNKGLWPLNTVRPGAGLGEQNAAVPVKTLDPVAGVVTFTYPVENMDPAARSAAFDARAAELTKQVKAGAEACRLMYLTGGAGKALTYEAKRAEARHYETAKADAAPADPAISEALYPFGYAEAAALNATATPTDAQVIVVLELYLTRTIAWMATGAEIEGLEQKAVADIETARAATDSAALEAAAVVVWPQPA